MGSNTDRYGTRTRTHTRTPRSSAQLIPAPFTLLRASEGADRVPLRVKRTLVSVVTHSSERVVCETPTYLGIIAGGIVLPGPAHFVLRCHGWDSSGARG